MNHLDLFRTNLTSIRQRLTVSSLSIVIFACCVSSASTCSYAHGDVFPHESFLKSGGSLTLRSDDMLEENQAYIIPGTQIGGEAQPYQKGLSVDNAFLSGGLEWGDYLFFSGEISAHEHGDHLEVALETASVSYKFSTDVNLIATIGRITSRSSPSANWHSGTLSLSDAWLQSDVHFGRHSHENGLRLNYFNDAWELGIEAFNGDNFPTSGRKGNFVLYSAARLQIEDAIVKFGLWTSRSKAEERRDERYSEGHSHSGDDIDVPSSEFSFSGDIVGFGGYIDTTINIDYALDIVSEIEYVTQSHEGQISNSTQSADIDYQPETFRVSAGVKAREHLVKIQWEKLIVTNEFKTDVDSLFLTSSNLHNDDFEPSKLTLAWHWEKSENIVLKTEWIREQLLEDSESNNRLNLGLSASFDLLAFNR